MNTYLIKSSSIRLLEEEIIKLSSKIENKITFDYSETNIQDIIEECSYFSLMSEQKVVIVKNYKLSSSKLLEDYIKNPNYNTTLILCTNDNIDKRLTIYKIIEEKGKIHIIDELTDTEIYNKILKYTKENNIKIKDNALLKLLEYNNNNYDLILSEIDKISILKTEITPLIVEEYASKIISSNNFALCDKIIDKNIHGIETELKTFKANKEEVIPFIGLLLSQYQLILAVMTMNQTDALIAKKLTVHPYRIKLAREKSLKYTILELKEILRHLTEVDYKIKSTRIDPYLLLENFIIYILK